MKYNCPTLKILINNFYGYEMSYTYFISKFQKTIHINAAIYSHCSLKNLKTIHEDIDHIKYKV